MIQNLHLCKFLTSLCAYTCVIGQLHKNATETTSCLTSLVILAGTGGLSLYIGNLFSTKMEIMMDSLPK